MSEEKLERWPVVITQVLDATGVFSQTITVPWTPEEVKIKELAFGTTGAAPVNGAWYLNCDSLTDRGMNSLGVLTDPCSRFGGAKYSVNRPVSGTHTFRVLTGAGIPATNLNGGNLIVHFEFRRGGKS